MRPSAPKFEPLRCFWPSGRFAGSGEREVSARERSLQGRGKKGGGTKLWKSSRILPKTSRSAGGPDGGSACRCPGNPRALFTSIGALSSRDRCEGEVTNRMVIICGVQHLHNTSFPAESPNSSLRTDLVDLQGGSGGEGGSAGLGEVFGEPPESLRVAWVTSLLVTRLEKVVACNAWGTWFPAAGFG